MHLRRCDAKLIQFGAIQVSLACHNIIADGGENFRMHSLWEMFTAHQNHQLHNHQLLAMRVSIHPAHPTGTRLGRRKTHTASTIIIIIITTTTSTRSYNFNISWRRCFGIDWVADASLAPYIIHYISAGWAHLCWQKTRLKVMVFSCISRPVLFPLWIQETPNGRSSIFKRK